MRPVNGFNHLEQRKGVLDLVALQVPDEVPLNLVSDLGNLRRRLLNPVFSKDLNTSSYGLANTLNIHRLGGPHEENLLRASVHPLSRTTDALMHNLHVLCNTHHIALSRQHVASA